MSGIRPAEAHLENAASRFTRNLTRVSVAWRRVEVAKEESIPVIPHVPLACAILENVDIDRFIPADWIKPMAEVLRWVKEVHGEQR